MIVLKTFARPRGRAEGLPKNLWFFGKEGHPPERAKIAKASEQKGAMDRWSSLKEHMENALASGAEEGRDKLR